MEDIEEAIDRVTMGLERKGMVISPKEKEKIAYHEAGHAIMSLMVPGSDALHKVSIIPRGMALGVTQQLPIDDKHMYDRQDLIGRLIVLFGGRAAEEVFYGKEGITTGAENDLQRATELAYRMVSMWGMSEKVGPGGKAYDKSLFGWYDYLHRHKRGDEKEYRRGGQKDLDGSLRNRQSDRRNL
jgi:membrane protease FtsH catalytic subunit (EC 3.4.24.-)